MVADLVYEHVGDQVVEADIAALDPFFQDRAAIEEDHCAGGRGVGDALAGEIDALVEPGQFERVVDFHFRQGLLIGEVLDADDDVAREVPETDGQGRPGRAGHGVKVVQGRGKSVGHRPTLGLRAGDLHGSPYKFVTLASFLLICASPSRSVGSSKHKVA